MTRPIEVMTKLREYMDINELYTKSDIDCICEYFVVEEYWSLLYELDLFGKDNN